MCLRVLRDALVSGGRALLQAKGLWLEQCIVYTGPSRAYETKIIFYDARDYKQIYDLKDFAASVLYLKQENDLIFKTNNLRVSPVKNLPGDPRLLCSLT